ncbi:MAG: GyrI-like domain-containing protein [Pontiellaceae bacterium]|nr:GyrI-like domain-containing protein [Pontiellaceae bacterium]
MDLTKDRKKLKELYLPGTEDFVLVDVPDLFFAVIDGEGSPEEEGASAAIQHLFKTIYPIRREARKRMGKSFVEPPPEMLYWADDMRDLPLGNKERWKWKSMVVLPEWADETLFSVEAENAAPAVRAERFEEGLCAQIMYVGDLQGIPALLERLYIEYLPQQGLVPAGAYHEIYLDDWRRIAPEKRRTVLRQPVRSIGA